MARRPENNVIRLPQPPGNEPAQDKKLAEEAKARHSEAKKQKAEFRQDILESYWFAAPHRMRAFSSDGKSSMTKPKETGEAATSLPCELTADFVGVVLDAFMPQHGQWCERRPGVLIPDEIVEEVTTEIKRQDKAIFEQMKASNLYAELPKAMNPDCAIGLFALWITDLGAGRPIIAQAIPLGQVDVNLGPHGQIDDRFVTRQVKYCHIKAVLPGVPMPSKIEEKILKEPYKNAVIRWGFWRKWQEVGTETWQKVVLVDEEIVDHDELRGEGCVPLIPIRFNPSPDWAIGDGPLQQSLPDMRSLDDLEAGKLDYVDAIIRPAVTYPDDSFAAIEQGIENGKAYPVRPGSEGAVRRIYEPGPADAALWKSEELQTRLQRLFFQDWPKQTGDTPPTATQWLDEMVMAQRRLGQPGSSFFAEGPAQIFLRYKWLMEQRGVIDRITVDGKGVSLQPYNPAQAAAEQQEVQMATRALEIAAMLFPEEYKARIDGGKTMAALFEKMRVMGLVAFRDEEEVAQAAQLIAGLMGGQQPGAPALPAPGAV
jgi:hypothetical protein